MPASHRRRGAWGLAALYAAAVAARVGAAVWLLLAGKATLPDSQLYLAYAKAVHAGAEYRLGDDGCRRPPGYPALIAAAWRVSGREPSAFADAFPDLLPILLLQALLGAVQAPLAWLLARRLGLAEPTSWIAGGLAAFDPLNVVHAGMVLTETAAATTLLAAACCWAGAPRARSAVGAGLLAAASLLVRPSALPILLAAWLLRRWPWRVKLLALAACAVACFPWALRNHRVYGKWIAATLNTGESLYDGWNPAATGGSEMSFRKAFRPPGATWQERELAADAHWRDEALRWARANPGRVAWLALEKLRRFWNPAPNADEFASAWARLAGWAWHLPVYVLAVWGIVRTWRDGPGRVWFLLAPALGFMLLHAAFVSSIRYRAPAMPFLEILAAAGAAGLLRRASA